MRFEWRHASEIVMQESQVRDYIHHVTLERIRP